MQCKPKKPVPTCSTVFINVTHCKEVAEPYADDSLNVSVPGMRTCRPLSYFHPRDFHLALTVTCISLQGLTLPDTLLLMIFTPPGREDQDSEEEDGLKGMRIPIARTGEPRKEGGALICEVCGPVLCLSYLIYAPC